MADVEGGVEVRGCRDADEERQAVRLAGCVMGAPEEFFAARFAHDPYGGVEHSRLALVGGAPVSHARVYRRRIRLGWGEVWVGAIGDVCTLPEHRRQGHARAVLQDAAGWLAARGVPLCTILSGVGVYERAGWEKVEEPHYTFRADDLRSAPPGGAVGAEGVRLISRFADEEALADVHDAHAEGRSLTLVRSRRYWRAHYDMALSERADACLLAERAGRPLAYVRVGVGGRDPAAPLPILEAPHLPGPDGVAGAAALLPALGRLAAKRGLVGYAGYLPADHPFLAAPHEARAIPHLLVRVLDLAAVLRAGLRGVVPPPGAPSTWVIRCLTQVAAVTATGGRWTAEPAGCGGPALGTGGTAVPATAQGPALAVSQGDLMRVLFRQAPPAAAWGRAWAWLDASLAAPAPVYWRADGV